MKNSEFQIRKLSLNFHFQNSTMRGRVGNKRGKTLTLQGLQLATLTREKMVRKLKKPFQKKNIKTIKKKVSFNTIRSLTHYKLCNKGKHHD